MDMIDAVQCLSVEPAHVEGEWTVRFKSLATGAELPDMRFAGQDKPELMVGGKYVVSVKATLAGN